MSEMQTTGRTTRSNEAERRARKRAEWLADLERPLRYVKHESGRRAAMGTHETEAHAYKRLGW